MHYVENGERYFSGDHPSKTDCPHRYLEIACCTPFGQIIDRKRGYDLFYKGKYVKHAKTVKELKMFAFAFEGLLESQKVLNENKRR